MGRFIYLHGFQLFFHAHKSILSKIVSLITRNGLGVFFFGILFRFSKQYLIACI